MTDTQTQPKPSPKRDRKRAEAIKYGQQLAQRKNGVFSTDEWKANRHKLDVEQGIEVASVATIYRWFGDWDAFQKVCNVREGRRERSNKCDEGELIANLKRAAELHGSPVLSTHAYDKVRDTYLDEFGAKILRSSSAIRKHLGPWPVACARAGIQSPDQKGPRRFSTAECRAALRRAKAGNDGMLTMQSYTAFVASLDEGDLQDNLPDLGVIVDEFGSWESALHFADVDQSSAVHPQTLWEASEVREIARQAKIVLRRHYKRDFDEAGYEFLCTQVERPMPSYRVLTWLLSQ